MLPSSMGYLGQAIAALHVCSHYSPSLCGSTVVTIMLIFLHKLVEKRETQVVDSQLMMTSVLRGEKDL
jgi:hypothetical protein